jgi:hypothetical protein
MGLLDNIFGSASSSSSAVPGGNVTKPLVIALLALLASRYMSGGKKEIERDFGWSCRLLPFKRVIA